MCKFVHDKKTLTYYEREDEILSLLETTGKTIGICLLINSIRV